MHRVVGALAAGRNHCSDTLSAAKVQLLESACCLIDSTSPNAISSTSVYVPASSREEAIRLTEIAHLLATEHRLLAQIQFGDGRLHVKFLSVSGDLGRAGGG